MKEKTINITKQVKLKNDIDLLIRSVEKQDAKYMITYMNKVSKETDFLTFGEGEIELTLEKEEGLIEELTKKDNNLFIVAIINNEIVGNLSFRAGSRHRIRHTGEMGITVLKDYWGLGVGTELVKYLIEWAQKSNIIKKINLRVREDNNRGMNLYKRLGFKKEGTITRDFYVDEHYYSSIFMGLEIK